MIKRFYMMMSLAVIPACIAVFAQAAQEAAREPAPAWDAPIPQAEAAEVLPLRRLSLFSSGVGYFEHRGTVNGPAGITLPFPVEAVNDALKSLTIIDPASASPQVSYPASDTLFRTLGSLKIDLSGNPGIPGILENLRGEELEVLAPNPIRGRIVAVENRRAPPDFRTGLPSGTEIFLSLAAPQGIRVINIKDITSYSFTNPAINADLNRALDLLMESRNDGSRNLTISLNGTGSRTVSLSYVIPQAVWKVSYRLDLSGEEPLLQGWAIIDNDSDTDWNGVELSLTAGRPVSFVQDLYSPYRLARPVLPLSIAGTAEARSYASGGGSADFAEAGAVEEMEAPLRQQKAIPPAYAPVPSPAKVNVLRSGGLADTVRASAAGGLFEFTLKNPVTLARRQSAMLPLVEGTVAAIKTLVFSGERAVSSGTLNPAISAELTNTTGMKLPAGPITVYDGGTYAGDALIEFFPEGEKRLISFGEDLSVSGSAASSYSRRVSAVTISGGIMTVTRKVLHRRTYTLRNASGDVKRVVVEHPITEGAVLVEPAQAEEKAGALYRFVRELPAREDFTFTVREETPAAEQLRLAQFRPETFAAYIADGEIPENLRAALSRAVELKGKADDAKAALEEIKTRRTRLTADQDRIRRNLEAAGNQTPQGQEYLRRLAALDAEFDALVSQEEEADKAARAAQTAYEDYLNGMEL
ncbi:MAG: DUF4139 domain-containing protein [Treponema sp.]|jgi:hypothetical protein|nr:DUF4139 domain-containing protein [Treponema sp.]